MGTEMIKFQRHHKKESHLTRLTRQGQKRCELAHEGKGQGGKGDK